MLWHERGEEEGGRKEGRKEGRKGGLSNAEYVGRGGGGEEIRLN